MREISYCFALVEPSAIQGRLLKRLPVPSGALIRKFMSNQKITFTQFVSKTENGLSWQQHFRATCKDASVLDFTGLRKHIAIFLADGKAMIVGNAMSAPLLKVTEHEDVYEITADFSTPEAPQPVFVL